MYVGPFNYSASQDKDPEGYEELHNFIEAIRRARDKVRRIDPSLL